MSGELPSSSSSSRAQEERGLEQAHTPTQIRGRETRAQGTGPATDTGDDDDDVQMIGEKVMIREDEGEGLPESGEGFRTPRGKSREGTRTPTGFTPDSKRNKTTDSEGEVEEAREKGEGGREGGASQHPQPSTPGVSQYSGRPVEPPPGIPNPIYQAHPESGLGGGGGLSVILQDFQTQMRQGFQDMGTQMQQIRTDINRDLGKLRAEQRETKDVATKALTVADTTQKEVQSLAKRVTALEQGKGPTQATRRTGASSSAAPGDLGYNALGGEKGTDMVLGEFDDYASREERRENLEIIKRALPEEITAQFEKEDAPGLRNKVMIISIKSSPEGPEKTRDNLVNICRQIRQSNIKYKDTDGNTRNVYANPTKPLAMRQMNAQVTLKADAIKKALGDERSEKIELELGKSRVFLGKDKLAQRQGFEGEMVYIWPTLNKYLPDATPESMAKLEEEVKAARAAQSSK